jgi:hypothetical protein
VEGLLRLGQGVRSIYVVLGDLRAKRIELGDAVLVVRGKVIAESDLFTPANEGIFDVHGEQRPERQARHIDAPQALAYDRQRRQHVAYVKRGTRLVKLDTAAIDPRLLRTSEDGERVVDPKRALARLRAGKPLTASP